MSDEVAKVFLSADRVILPFELVRGNKYVYNAYSMNAGDVFKFDFVEDDDGPSGPTKVLMSPASKTEVEALNKLTRDERTLEVVAPQLLDITWIRVTADKFFGAVVQKVTIGGQDTFLELTSEGAIYPNAMIVV